MTSAAELKRLIGQRKAITVPGTANALFARVIQDLGYEIVPYRTISPSVGGASGAKDLIKRLIV